MAVFHYHAFVVEGPITHHFDGIASVNTKVDIGFEYIKLKQVIAEKHGADTSQLVVDSLSRIDR